MCALRNYTLNRARNTANLPFKQHKCNLLNNHLDSSSNIVLTYHSNTSKNTVTLVMTI